MKIAHVIWTLGVGGIETMIVNIANEQVRAGHDVSLIVINNLINNDVKARLCGDIKLIELGRPVGSHNPWYIFKLNRSIARLGCDVVHFHHVNVAKYVYKPILKKWCTTHHTTWRPELAQFFKDNPHICAISNEVRQDILAHGGPESTVILNGIKAADFKQKSDYSRTDCRPHIVQIGRLNLAVKGQDLLIDAVERLRSRGLDVRVDFIGDGKDRSTIENLIKDKGLENRIKLLGVKDMPYLHVHLCEYDAMVQPSRIEGFGLSVAEGMAAGVPVIVSDLPALKEVVDDGQFGYIFKSNDAEACADAIAKVINQDNSEICHKARRRVEELYDVRNTAENYINYYESL